MKFVGSQRSGKVRRDGASKLRLVEVQAEACMKEGVWGDVQKKRAGSAPAQ
jgi:hypothetical protein